MQCGSAGLQRDESMRIYCGTLFLFAMWFPWTTRFDQKNLKGIFPCNALFNNLDHLLWRAHEGGDSEKALASFPWIVWFIWKARNEKVFEGKDIMPLDTLQQAMAETEAWTVAQIVAEALDETQKNNPPILPNQNVIYPRCQVDASWVYETNLFGGGLVMELEADSRVTGSFANPQVLSPLHAEFHI
ncbi:unnamed protein product [Microthlaspi erraticum]|uniref:RNase H type-1 domain-containing protein n=1 Tax=Microthlaspi erraticum TaxID=1685480 RepID=A0A6D2KMX7_9BRAS|nr:unnamed protein product [Microthlaspi erraticum]